MLDPKRLCVRQVWLLSMPVLRPHLLVQQVILPCAVRKGRYRAAEARLHALEERQALRVKRILYHQFHSIAERCLL